MTYLRRLPKFEYVGPRSLPEVCSLISGGDRDETMLLAGGTDAILQMRRRERVPRRVIGLKGVSDLDFVREQTDGSLAIGAMTTLHTLLTAPAVGERYAILSETLAQIGGPELRNLATIGGNIAGALPCADLPPALMTLDAKVKLSSHRGERWMPLPDFFPAFGNTVAKNDEVLAEINLPMPAPHGAGTYIKFHDRQSMDMTVVGVSAYVVLEDDRRTIRELRLAFANSAPTVFRAKKAEACLREQPLTEKGLDETAEVACAEASPRTSWRANAGYRLSLIRALTKRAIRRSWEIASSQKGTK